MAIMLKRLTASQEVPIGPFLDDTDGKTAKTGLTIANTDIKLWKNGATALVNKNSGGATHMANGIYYMVMDATDTASLGPMVAFIHVVGALPVRVELDVNDKYDVAYVPNTLMPADTYRLQGDIDDATLLRYFLKSRGSGTTIAGTLTTTVMTTNLTSAVTDAYKGLWIAMTSGPNLMAQREITAYNGSTKAVTVSPAFGAIPTAGDTFVIFAGISAPSLAPTLNTIQGYVDELETRLTATRAGYLDNLNSGVPLSAAGVDAVWDEALAAHNTAGSAGYILSNPTGVNVTQLDGSATAAANLKNGALALKTGTTVAGTLTTTQMTTDVTGLPADAIVGRLISFLPAGNVQFQQRRIIDYVAANGFITLEVPLTSAPSVGHVFIIQ